MGNHNKICVCISAGCVAWMHKPIYSTCVGDCVGVCTYVAGTGVSVFSLHPGVVQSDLWRHQHQCIQVAVKIFRIFTKTTVEGAQTTIYCAVEPGLESQSGGYFRYTHSISSNFQLVTQELSECCFILPTISTCWLTKKKTILHYMYWSCVTHSCVRRSK